MLWFVQIARAHMRTCGLSGTSHSRRVQQLRADPARACAHAALSAPPMCCCVRRLRRNRARPHAHMRVFRHLPLSTVCTSCVQIARARACAHAALLAPPICCRVHRLRRNRARVCAHAAFLALPIVRRMHRLPHSGVLIQSLINRSIRKGQIGSRLAQTGPRRPR